MRHKSPGSPSRLTEYGARPTVYIPHEPSPPPRNGRPAGALRVVRAVIGALLFLAGTPALLWTLGGNPVRLLPTWEQTALWFDRPSGRLTPTVLAGAAVWALWLLWAVFALLLLVELIALTTRWRVPALRLPAPLHRLVFGLAGAAAFAVGSGAAHAAVADTAPATTATAGDTTLTGRPGSAEPALIQVGEDRYLYTVERHDTMSKIAKRWLGAADRWPEICALNKHRHFPEPHGKLRDCNLIRPGWELRLPSDAVPPHGARPVAPQPPPTTPTPPRVPDPTPSATADREPTAPHRSPTTPAPPASAIPTTPAAPSADDPQRRSVSGDEHGVRLSPSDWLPWSVAAAITTTATLVWAQRRRRFTGEPDTDPPTDLPPPVRQLRHATAGHPEPAPSHQDERTPPPQMSDLAPLPPGGIGLTGTGAPAAARGTLAAVLATGDPHHPHARGEVVIDAGTLTTLLGDPAAALHPWPRLHITDTVDDALTAIEARLLHHSRILDEHALTDLDTLLRRQSSDEQALPPVVLVTQAPPAGAGTRAKTTLTLGGDLHVTALLLGEWAHGVTVEVTADGHTTLTGGDHTAPVPARLPTLEADTALHILTTLREAHTGEAPAADASAAPPPDVVPLHAHRTAPAPTTRQTPTTAPPADTTPGKARLRLLGPPRIDDITQPGRPLRAKALELAVFLACHPDGVTTREIGEYLEPDARLSQADQRVHTNASNLRHVLRRAGTADTKNAYVIKTAGRYRLDPTTVDVDVWTLRDLLRSATIATGERRRELLTAACDLCTAPLADGQDYEWLPPHRETVRRWGTEAHLLLADDLLRTDPHAASDLLDKAIGLDRYNEALYTRAMHARHALDDPDGIRTLLRALTRALADIDATPQEATTALANQLRASPTGR